VTGTTTFNGSGAVGGDISNDDCQVNGSEKVCSHPPVKQDAWNGGAIEITGGWGIGLSLGIAWEC